MRISDWSSDVCSSDLKQVQTDIEIPAKFAQTASNVPQITIAVMSTEMGKGSPKAEKSDNGIQGGSKHGDKVEADQKQGLASWLPGVRLAVDLKSRWA